MIVVVGAGLAGTRAAEELRTQGYEGPVVLVGDEPHRPYDRPPLSKQVLAGTQPPEATELAGLDELDVEWRLGVRATALDAVARRLTFDDGTEVEADGIVLATGATPRRIPGWEGPRVHVLRSLDDCAALRADLGDSTTGLLVVGAGFIGAEVAATARGLGLAVTMVEPLSAPVVRGLGEAMGAVVADLHREHGVDLRLGTGVEALTPGGARLTDGTEVAADTVLVGIGVVPATAWLEGSGLVLEDGIACDPTGLAAPGIVAAGDSARWDHPLYGSVRLEHWDNAVEQGAHVARTLLADLAGGTGEPYAPVPWFWSDQYDRKLQVAGRTSADCDVEVVAGSVEERRFTALYGKDGRLVAVLGMNMPAKVVRWRRVLAEGGRSFAEAVEEARST